MNVLSKITFEVKNKKGLSFSERKTQAFQWNEGTKKNDIVLKFKGGKIISVYDGFGCYLITVKYWIFKINYMIWE